MGELLTPEEIDDRLAVIPACGAEYEALVLLRHAYYLEAEGFITIDGGRCYPAAE